VRGAKGALDLTTIECAGDVAREEDFGGLEIVASFGEPDCELVLPVGRKTRSSVNAPPARAQSVASPPPADLARRTALLPPAPLAPRLT